MIDPEDPLEVQVAKQAKIIDALIRRATREHDVGNSAYAAFQSAISLQGQVWAKTRDLERASHELAELRFDKERSRKTLEDALSVMEGGFALFEDGRLQVFNDLFRNLLPDISGRIAPGLPVEDYVASVARSDYLVSRDRGLRQALTELRAGDRGRALSNVMIELAGDRWYQFSQQQTTSDNIVIVQTDITDIVRKNRLEKDHLIDMQAHYLQSALDHMSLGVGTFSSDGTLMLHNQRFSDLLGLPAPLLKEGTRFDDILAFIKRHYGGGDSGAEGAWDWWQRLREIGRFRARIRHVAGRVLDIHLHLLPDQGFLVDIADTTLEARSTELLERRVEERTSALTEVNRQLTEQSHKQALVEEELRVAKEAAEAAVSSKTRFLAAASHDLLQPVNAAKLLISTLADSARETPLADLVGRLEGSFASIETLLHALLDISRLESTGTGLASTDFCLGPLMRSVAQDQDVMAREKGVQLDVVPCNVWVHSDPRYLMRSIQNLVVNAIQYTEKGRVLLGCRRRGDRVVLEVWDTGIGISHQDQTRIFDEFTRAENVPPGSGMGLGLSIVDRTCRHLGHKVGVRSKPGVGSVFSIEMKTVAPKMEAPVPDIGPVVSADTRMNLLALVVENDPDVLAAMVSKLESWGAGAFSTRSTAEAVEVVRDMGMAPDIILADFQLDGHDTGIHAIETIREMTGCEVPAVVITANRTADLMESAEQQDFSVLAKPVNLTHLRGLIARKTRFEPERRRAGSDQSIA
ncbi:hybrid sensor histidine kinase/response regulator [Poseidonocella sedimentorum]|uniref:histidine kinase n=1 Tax=Poseidonocella sedimentorum TaxID=871652 RepID=A0A1I6D3T0_9RHOB|nr:PAS-domain containing protein [Poseidonocella sedimentorum]SFR00134.1 Signal transduction histidine kinase [Poseidonocella sedimentorum]